MVVDFEHGIDCLFEAKCESISVLTYHPQSAKLNYFPSFQSPLIQILLNANDYRNSERENTDLSGIKLLFEGNDKLVKKLFGFKLKSSENSLQKKNEKFSGLGSIQKYSK